MQISLLNLEQIRHQATMMTLKIFPGQQVVSKKISRGSGTQTSGGGYQTRRGSVDEEEEGGF